MNEFSKLKRKTGIKFITPTIVTLSLVIFFPLLFSFGISFFRYTFINPSFDNFVFLDNFIGAFQDQYFWNSMKVTLVFVGLVVPLEFLVGYTISLLINRDIKFKSLFYIILTIPMVMSPVAVGLIWKVLLHPDMGVVNYFMSVLGLPYVNWLGSSKFAIVSLVLVDIWHQVSFMILILLAGLASLPKEPQEAAIIDGANWFQILIYITTALMKPIIMVAVLMRVILAFRTYDLIYVMTKGGPGISTDIISYFIYKKTFMGLDLSQASAISYLLLLVVMIIVVILFRQMVKNDE